jgi:hypothetical protein
MSSQPALRIYHEPPLEAAAEEAGRTRGADSRQQPVLAVLFSAAVHVVVLVTASVAAALFVSDGVSSSPAVPDHPLHTIFIALILAQCGLASVFFAGSSWPVSSKLVVGSLVLGCLWLLLVGTMETTKQTPIAAGAWAACLVVEAIAVWLSATGVEFAANYQWAVARSRFGLLHLLFGMTLVAVCLGGGRQLATRYGFALADVPEWDFFWHVQAAAIVNSVLAAGLYACLRWSTTWSARATISSALVVAVAFAAPLAFIAIFSQNTSLTEMRWLFGSEGLFLIATLWPMQMLRDEPTS